MSLETREWLSTNTLVGFTENRGNAWHYRQGDDNHYPGAIPLDDVEMRLFNWFPTLSPLYVEEGEGFTPVPGKVGVRRSDNGRVLGIFGEDYPETSYHDRLITPVSHILSANAGELAIGSAGLLSGGGRAWIQVEIPETVKTAEGVDFRPTIVAASSLDGTLSNTYKAVNTVVVCDNTLSMALSEKGREYKVKNTKYSAFRLAQARAALELIFKTADEFTAQVTAMCATTITDREWFAFLDAYKPLPEDSTTRGGKVAYTRAENTRDQLTAMYRKDPRCEPWTGTAFGVLQTANTYNQHEAGVRKGAARAERNFANVLTGKTEDQDAEALNALNKVLALA